MDCCTHHSLVEFFWKLLWLLVHTLWSVTVAAFSKQLPALRISPLTVGVFLGAWFVFSVLRNLPWAPFTWFYV